MAHAQCMAQSTESYTLADVLERVLDKGLVIVGDIKIKLCDVELLSVQLRLLICSVDKAQELGIPWWWEPRISADNGKAASTTSNNLQSPLPEP